MEFSQRLLCFLFLASFAVGILLGLVYDILYLSRLLLGCRKKTSPTDTEVESNEPKALPRAITAVLLFAEDFLFILLCGICLILLLYFINDGVFRFWSPLGMMCGFYVYRMTVGRLFLAISEQLIKLIIKILKLILMGVLFPFRAVIRFLMKRLVSPIFGFVCRMMLHRRINATNKEAAAFLHEAENVFATENEQLWK